MNDIDIVIPSYGRPGAAFRAYQSVVASTVAGYRVNIVVEEEQFEAYRRVFGSSIGTDFTIWENERTRSYAGAVNTFLDQSTQTRYVFLGADDVRFHRYWDVTAIKTMNALPNVKVVGTNDLLNEYVLKGWHATHYLIDRDYLDSPGGVVDGQAGHALFEGYSHNFTDTEFVGTAKARAAFAPCLDSVVEHLHWQAGKSVKDATSEKAYADYDQDFALYESRKHLWWGLSR